jgi:hypothetical protein
VIATETNKNKTQICFFIIVWTSQLCSYRPFWITGLVQTYEFRHIQCFLIGKGGFCTIVAHC